jgi:transglutaminase-like putative cysteine protease
MRSFPALCAAVLTGLSCPVMGEEIAPEALDPQAPCTAERSNPVTYDVDYSVVVTPPYGCQKLQVWLPLPQSDAGQEVTEGSLTSFPLEVAPQFDAEPVFGNRFAYFEYDRPQGAQIIRHRFGVKVWELHWELDPARVAPAPRQWPSAFEPYLRSEGQAVVVDDRIRSLAGQIVPQPAGPLADLAALLAWADANLRYDHRRASLAASSLHALEQRCGHCSDYHGLCAAVGRSLGYPTRIAYGINPFPKNSPSHCKLEVFLPPYGWVSFDVSETQNLVAQIAKDDSLDDDAKAQLAAAARRRLLRGFRDNTWFLQTRGSDYELAPPASRRVPVVRTIYAEADGVALDEPDPADPHERAFAWMTVHKYTADRQVTYPFQDWRALESERE